MNKLKVMAFYLPQFHSIPENDEWWGKGFTDWVNVRKGVPHSKGQEQPRIPLNNNYYDLSKVETLRWQADLMRKYNVYGLCFYHYWFDGKLLLEKPSELLLSHKDIDIRFCFSWANEPWARTWDGRNSSVLMPQSYGGREEWEGHFNYLLPFFLDDRYIKENGRPMFLIYKSSSIELCKEMMELWDSLAKRNGLKGMHFVETIRGTKDETRKLPYKAKVEFEPARTDFQAPLLERYYSAIRRRVIKFTNEHLHTHKPINKALSFNEVSQQSLDVLSPKGTYGGVFVGWDNTARKGLRSTLILPPTKDEFYKYLKNKAKITRDIYETNYVFVNAWNEWAEGTYLEPDTIHGYDYLEAVKQVVEENE